MGEYASAGLVALLVPQANATVEAEMSVLLPPGCGAITARLTSASQDSRQRLLDYWHGLEAALRTFDVAKPDAALFAVTGSSYLVDTDISRAGYPIVSAAAAIGEALEELGVRRFALMSPYPAWLTEAAVAYWRAKGREITQVIGFEGDRTDTRNIYALGSRDAIQNLPKTNEVILITGTGMPSLGAIARKDGVISSNLCLAWKAARLVGAGPADIRAWMGPSAWWRPALAARFPAAAG